MEMKWLISSSVEKIKPEYQFSKQERMKDSLFCTTKNTNHKRTKTPLYM